MNNKILLIGAGGHASTIIDIIERDLDFEIAGLISKLITKDKLCGYEIIGTDKDLPLLRKN